MEKRLILALVLIFALTMVSCSSAKTEQPVSATAAPAEAAPEPAAEGADVLDITDYLAEQAEVDAKLITEAETGYKLDDPLVVVNPYGNAPLSAIVLFTTDDEIGGTVTVKGKSHEDDITGTFAPAKTHFVPIYGLYAGDITEVEIRLDDDSVGIFQVEAEMPNTIYEGFTAEMHESDLYEYNRLNVCCFLTGSVLAGFDSHADLRWFYMNTGVDGVRVSENGHLLVPCGLQANSAGMGSSMLGVDEIDFTGKIYARYIWPGGVHHDFMELPGGNLLALADTPDKPGSMDYIVEIDRGSGEVIWTLALSDLVRTDDSGAAMNSARDWSHGNGICYDEATDTLIVSCRNQDAIFGIRKAEKKLVWLLGDPAGWEDPDPSLFFTPVGENFEWQYGAHNVSLLDNGDILLFDNGLGGRVKIPNADKKLADEDNYSRAVIYRIDTDNMTIEQVWQHGKELGSAYYASIMSGATPLDGLARKILIDFGTCKADTGANGGGMSGNITRLRYLDNDRLVWEMQYSGGPTYRAFRICPYDIDFDGVGVEGRWTGSLGVTKEIEASAPETSDSAPETVTVENYPFNAIRVAGTMKVSAEEIETTPYIVLTIGGEQHFYSLAYTKTDVEDEKLLTLNTWISLEGLPEAPFGVILVFNGVGMTI